MYESELFCNDSVPCNFEHLLKKKTLYLLMYFDQCKFVCIFEFNLNLESLKISHFCKVHMLFLMLFLFLVFV